MEKGNQMGITPITGINVKSSNKEIERILYEVNEVLYFFSTLYIKNSVRDYVLNKIEHTGKELKGLNLPRESKSIDRRNEVLSKLREKYSIIKKYFDYSSSTESMELERKMNSYLVARFLKDKKENNLGIDNKFKWIKNIKFFSEFYSISSSLESVQNELLDSFKVYKAF